MREFLEAIAGAIILAALALFIVYVSKQFLGSDAVEDPEKQIGIEMIKQYQRRITELERDIIYYETFCNGLKTIKTEDKDEKEI